MWYAAGLKKSFPTGASRQGWADAAGYLCLACFKQFSKSRRSRDLPTTVVTAASYGLSCITRQMFRSAQHDNGTLNAKREKLNVNRR